MINEVAKSIAIIRETHIQMSEIDDDKLLEGIKLIHLFLMLL